MDETFQVLVHGENYVLRFVESDREHLPYDESFVDDDASDEAMQLSYAELSGFYTTVTLTVANPGQLRGAVLQILVNRLRKSYVSPIRYNKVCSYFRIEHYKKLTNLEESVSEGGGFTFYPASIWMQIWSIITYHWRSLLCQIGLKDPICRPGIIHTLHTGQPADSGHALGSEMTRPHG